MKVVADNSGCCAIKHIRNFPYSPDVSCYIDTSERGHDEDQESSAPEPYENWADAKKIESHMNGEKLLRHYVEEIKSRRPAGMITINLTDDCDEDDDGNRTFNTSRTDAWGPLLEELGFTDVIFLNSNSGNLIHHYTLVYDEGDWEA